MKINALMHTQCECIHHQFMHESVFPVETGSVTAPALSHLTCWEISHSFISSKTFKTRSFSVLSPPRNEAWRYSFGPPVSFREVMMRGFRTGFIAFAVALAVEYTFFPPKKSEHWEAPEETLYHQTLLRSQQVPLPPVTHLCVTTRRIVPMFPLEK